MKSKLSPSILELFSMKLRLIFIYFIVIFFSCKKDEISNQQDSTDFYFEATLSDGRTFKLKEATQPSTSQTVLHATFARVDLGGATKYTVTDGIASDNSCGPGRNCFIWGIILLNAEKEGTYHPDVMSFIAYEGTEMYTYGSTKGDSTTPAKGNVNMIISKMEEGTAAGTGILQGTFSGTVMRSRESVPNVETPVQVSGKFRLALY